MQLPASIIREVATIEATWVVGFNIYVYIAEKSLNTTKDLDNLFSSICFAALVPAEALVEARSPVDPLPNHFSDVRGSWPHLFSIVSRHSGALPQSLFNMHNIL